MATTSYYVIRKRPRATKRPFYLSFITVLLSVDAQSSEYLTEYRSKEECDHNNNDPAVCGTPETKDYLTEYREWEDAPASKKDFDHDNDPSVCGITTVTVEEWEAGRYWEGNRPVLVKNVTDGWAALKNWKKQEMLRLYPDAEATMGEARLVGATGPDAAGSTLTPTTVKEFLTKHMYDPLKYFFDRKISIPKGMLEDCHPFPMPTRAYLENPDIGATTYALSKKKKVRTTSDEDIWRDHLAISIGADLQGLNFHRHRQAWNVVLFGAKRWILWDAERVDGNETRAEMMTRNHPLTNELLSSPQWIKMNYPNPQVTEEIRAHGYDCVQRAGEMMFVPHQWAHMVVNIGDTVCVVSEIGLGAGKGHTDDDFIDSEDESEDWEYEDEDEEGEDDGEWTGEGEYYEEE